MERRLLFCPLDWSDWKRCLALSLRHCDDLDELALLRLDDLRIGQTAASTRALEGLPEVPGDSDDTVWAWKLHLEVGLMSAEHELGKCGQAQQCMIGTAEVGDLKPNRLSPEIFLSAKDDIQPNTPQGGARQSRDNPMEGRPTALQVPLGEPKLDQGISVQDVDCASAIDQHSGKLARELWSCDQSINHKRITAGIRQDRWVIDSAPGYVAIGPLHELRNQWHSSINLLSSGPPTALVGGLACEDHVGSILPRILVLLLRWTSVLGWWWG